MNEKQLIDLAASLAKPFSPSEDCTSGAVGAALVTAAGNVYSGVCVDVECGIGFCAEHAAIAEMLKARESEIRLIVAVNQDGIILPPCGRCRELMWQVDARNKDTVVIVGEGQTARLSELLPRR